MVARSVLPFSASIVRWQFVCRLTRRCGACIWRMLAQLAHVALQEGNFLLLAHDDLVELVQQIFVEAGLDFQISESLLNGVGLIHAKYLLVTKNKRT